MLNKHNFRMLIATYYPLLAVLIGVLLVSLPMGPYETLDTQLEYNTTRGVLRWGYPFLDRFGEASNQSYGDLFNMPPLGFYTQAASFTVFGVSLQNGVFLVTLFGVGSAVMVYLLGKEQYGKTTGLFAAALFALAPWQLILTRAFLIDVQCLFLSLIYLYVGLLAIKQSSVKLAGLSGVFFALALLTKQNAVFMLVPLLLLYLYHRPKTLQQLTKQVAAFSLPAVFSTIVWYNVIMGKGFLYLLGHNDFADLNFPEVTATYLFVPRFLVDYGLGVFFVFAVAFSFVVGLLFWRYFPRKTVFFDFTCLATVLAILGLVMFLAVNLNLKAPYTSAVKYLYVALPFFALAAASLVAKTSLLFKSARQFSMPKKAAFFGCGAAAVALLAAVLVANLYSAQQLAMSSYVIFRVQPNLDVGYSFVVQNPLYAGDPLMWVQVLGFLVVLSGLFWVARRYLVRAFEGLGHSGV